MVVEGWCNDRWAMEGKELLEGQTGMLKALASGWRAGESFMKEWSPEGFTRKDWSVGFTVVQYISVLCLDVALACKPRHHPSTYLT